jgi:UPF0716 protein FxsA
MFVWLLLLFITMPIIELSLLMRLADATSIGTTIGLVIATGALGAWLARRQGISTWTRVQTEMAAGRLPTSEIVDAMLIFVAGVVLVTPGIITDAFGFALLVPPIRNVLKAAVAQHFKSRFVIMGPSIGPNSPFHNDDEDDAFVDVEVTEVRDLPTRSDFP